MPIIRRHLVFFDYAKNFFKNFFKKSGTNHVSFTSNVVKPGKRLSRSLSNCIKTAQTLIFISEILIKIKKTSN